MSLSPSILETYPTHEPTVGERLASITVEERRYAVLIEGTMASCHKVSSALRMIDCPKQPQDFKLRLRAELSQNIEDMLDMLEKLHGQEFY